METGWNAMSDLDADVDFFHVFSILYKNNVKPSIFHFLPSENAKFCHCSF
jgi:hypothetical protein